MIPFLPPEIIQNIIENVEYDPSYSWLDKDLIRCCQVSKTFLAFARPLLYEDIRVQLLTATHPDYSGPQFEVAKRGDSLIKTFRGNQDLPRLVKKVMIFEMGGNTWSYRHGGCEPLYLLEPMFDLPNVETITIEDLLHFEEIEEAVTAAQNRWIADGRVRMPALRAHGYGDGEVENLSLKAIYEGYNSGWAGHTGSDWSANLAPSHHSLRRLDIPFDASTSLSCFSQLERLSLRFLHRDPLDPIPNFLRVLRALTSLQLLILNNHISVDSLKSLLGTGALAASLPQSLTTLSLNLFPTHPDTLTFVRDLPDLTSLKYFNYEGEKGGLELQGNVELECHRRGIELSLNKEWEIWCSNSTPFTPLKSSTSPMIPYIPPELLRAILTNLSIPGDLARCCSASKTLLSISQPLIYNRITVDMFIEDRDRFERQLELEWSMQAIRMLETLRLNSHLRALVTQVEVNGIDEGEVFTVVERRDAVDFIRQIIQLLPNLKVMEIRGLDHYFELDNAVVLAQKTSSNTVFRLVGANPEHASHALLGLYEGYEFRQRLDYDFDWETVLAGSFDTLKRLDATFHNGSSHLRFPHLERLTLRLTDLVFDTSCSIGLATNLLRHLSALQSLHILVLATHNIDYTLSFAPLLCDGSLAAALPPNLAHLSIDIAPDVPHLLLFLRDLPSTIGLRVFNCLGGKGAEQEIEAECKKRGINLTLNEEWDRWQLRGNVESRADRLEY